MDALVQKYVLKVREQGGVINTAIVIASAKGILKQMDRTLLAEYGGHVTLSVSWAKSLLKRMHFTKRRATTKSGLSIEAFQEIKKKFLRSVIEVVQMESIPVELIFNWEQTGIHLIPQSNWTMEKKGSKRVEVKGLQNKRQITAVLCGTLLGDLLPIQLVYGGKTSRCHPPYSFPADWSVTHSQNHWSNESTMLEYVNNVIVPYVDKVRDDLGVDDGQAALALFDHFKGQMTSAITDVLEKHNIQSILIPANCTDRLPLGK